MRPAILRIIFLLMLLPGGVLDAQINTASLSGLATDSSGAALAKVTVTATSSSTGYSRTVRTDPAGLYSFQDLPIGPYTIEINAPGFKSLSEEVTLHVGEKAREDFHLQVGSTSQTVEVQAAASALSPDDSSIGMVVESKTIEETPLSLRNWDDLLRIVPGVQISRYTQQSGATSAGRVGDFNVNGIHSLQNDFILDGIDNNTFSENVQELSTESSHPSVDTIAEFNAITNPYSAEYGRSPGAVVSVNTKSGANQIHGLAYEYVRNNYFDSNDFFSDRHGLRKPKYNQNQFGGNLGGPILKDRLFFFFDYEGTRIKQGVLRTTTVPLPNERIGDFSPATAAAVGVKYPTIYDPSTCQPAFSGSNCRPFNNNKIPAGEIDPAMARLMALFPLPNTTTAGSPPDLNNYIRNALLTDNDDNYDARIDWTPSSSDTVFARYNYSNRYRAIPGYLGGLADGTSTSAWGNQTLLAHSAVLGWTHIVNQSIVNEFRFGWVRNYSYAAQQPFSLPQRAGDFVPGIPDNPAIGGGVPLTSFSNFAFEGSPDFLPKQQAPMQYQYNDTLSMIRGRHTLKFGVSVYLPMRNLFQDEPGTRGDLNFTGVFTCQHSAPGKCVSGTGFSYADGLLGATQYTQLSNVFFVDQRLWMASGFVEDDWKATPKLTLNLGLRYDFATPAMDGRNRMADFNPASGTLIFAKSGSLQDRTIVKPNTKDFGPRLGISYSPDSKTVLRGGYGIYYSLFERIGSENELALNPPYLINKTLTSNTEPVLTPSAGFSSGFLDPATINLNALNSFHIRAVPLSDPATYVQQWSIGIQRQIGAPWVAEVDYVGTKSTHLDVIYNYNQPIISGNVSTGVVPYNNFGQIEYTAPIGFGIYSGLQASLTRRFTNGLNLRAAFTHSRSLDNSPEELESNSGDAPNGRDYAAWYGPSDFDIPNRVAVSYVYDLPFGRGKAMLQHGPLAWILGNWETSGVYTYYSGHPFQVNENDGNHNSVLDPYGYTTATPNLVGKPHIVGDPDCWFYTSKNSACGSHAPSSYTDAYATTAVGAIGNVGRNTLRGPHTDVFDAALLREFPFADRWNVEARWEVFNVTNTPEFGQPQGNITNGGVAGITTLSGDPRVMQFALRLSW
ncbi:MAG TPA: carboxypeptidase regulatory-like domain-containing protein [Acidobacteriaceae bacterium]|nr:carboxypeptidase regulatory-like domain-containing protein [Acidobacteriaceae bacterium]